MSDLRQQLEATADAVLNDDESEGLDTYALACKIVDWQLPVILEAIDVRVMAAEQKAKR